MSFFRLQKLGSILVLIVTLSCGPLWANVKLPKIFSDHMMFQREQVIRVWGEADPREKIEISFNNEIYTGKADRDGKWEIELEAMKAGGPFEMTLSGKNTIVLKDILIGDLWICSGQSNMEWPLHQVNNSAEEIRNASFQNIRIFSVPKKIAVVPQNDMEDGSWQICSPESIPGFSAVAYFFGRHLHRELGVPIGLIGSNWGGTIVETWTSREGFEGVPDYDKTANEVATLNLEEKEAKNEEKYKEWLKEFQTGDQGSKDGNYLWNSPDYIPEEWPVMTLPILWEQSGDKELESANGVVWFIKEVELTAGQLMEDALLSLGPVDDSDITWVNGKKIGETYNIYNRERKYEVPSGILKEGKNRIVVRVEDYRGGGGLFGGKEQLYLKLGQEKISLAGTWKYRAGMITSSEIPGSQFGPNSLPTLLYNGMIAPLITFPIKGAIWYQGESNAGQAYQYRTHFKLLIEDWRAKWKIGDFPFLWVQLANFMSPVDQPAESEWAELREAQDKTLSLPHTGMASAIDIGEEGDIHPRNKQDVGYRLALEALKVAYGKDLVSTGPRFESYEIDGDGIVIRFLHTGKGLVVKDKYQYIKGFTIAGADKKFHWARAELVDAATVRIYSDLVKSPVAVRYGWANNPDQANLYNSENLPANPFRTDDWEGVTAGKKRSF